MRYSADDLKAAGRAGLITPEQVDALLAFFANRAPAVEAAAPAPKFDIVHLLWYAGALIVMSAMGLFSTLAFSTMGGTTLTVTAVVYAVLFTLAGHRLWTKKNLPMPGGLLIAVAVSMAPLAVYGVQDALGMWSKFGKPGTVRDFYVWIRGSWLFMELAAIAAAALALRFYRFPFLVLIIAIALWFLSMDIVPWITGAKTGNYETARKVSIAFGLAMLVIAAFINTIQRSGDFAFWLYLFGMMAFWGGVTATANGTTLDKALYGLMNVGLLFLAIFLGRRVFAVFGTIGITIYLGDLASKVFKDAILFPFALSLIGVAIIALGLYVHRRQHAISAWFDTKLPEWLRRLRPANATGI